MSADFYQILGIPKVINASGTLTALGGSRMFSEAAEAMASASQSFVDMHVLRKKVGERIAEMLRVEAALVTAGAASGLVQSAAACMAGCDPYCRSRLPDCPPDKREIVVMRCHRNPYDIALVTAGARLVEIGDAIRTELWELEGAINQNTAAVLYVMMSEVLDASLTLQETILIAHQRGVPVIVDAAAELPPKRNLWDLAQQGADLVLFSGGKDLRGPQASGLIVGRKDLVEACAFHAAPFHSVGRPMKASKEIIIGLLTALECYLEEDEDRRFMVWERMQQTLLQQLGLIEGLQVIPYQPTQPGIHPLNIPRLKLNLTGDLKITMDQLVEALKTGDPSIMVERRSDAIVLHMHTLDEQEVEIIVEKFMRIFSNFRELK